MNKILNIRDYNLAAIENKLTKLNKRCVKYGFPDITYNVLREYNSVVTLPSGDKAKIPMVEIEIVGDLPYIEGWEIVGVIDHEFGLNIITGEDDIPSDWHDRDPFCDHCNTKRAKKETVLIRKDGEIKQVGKTCLKEYVNIDIVRLLDIAIVIDSMEEDDEIEIGSNHPTIYFPITEVLKVAIGCVELFGFFPARNDNSTVNEVFDFYFSRKSEVRKRLDPVHDLLPKYDSKVEEVLEFIKSKKDTNTYFYNLNKMLESDIVKPQYFAMLIGSLSSFYRMEEKKVEAKAEVKCNEFYGTVGERETFNLTVKRYINFTNAFGVVTMYLFLDETGRTFVWVASNPIHKGGIPVEAGEDVTVKATIKEHKLYGDIKQTVITRGKVVDGE